MSYGVTADGFVSKPLSVIEDEIKAALRAAFGASIDTSPASVFGVLAGIVAEQMHQSWDLAEAVNTAFSVLAGGTQLDNISALTGTVRKAALPSTVDVIATGTPATVLASGRVMSVASTGVKFTTTEAATIAAATAWASGTVYAVGDIRKNSSKIYRCITGGTSAGSGGPTGTGTDITDNTVHWRYLGDGTGYVSIHAESQDTGPKVALAYTLTTIETPASGWSNVTNILDAAEGRDEETDAALRIRREDELRAAGSGSVEAIRGALLELTGVTSAVVLENTTLVTDGDGVPGKAFECVVGSPTDMSLDDTILATIFENKPAGIETSGSITGTVTDSVGADHTVKFSRPAEVNIYVAVSLTKDPSAYPADGDDQVIAALLAYGEAKLITGRDVVASALSAEVFKVPGVLDVGHVYIATSPSPVSAATVVIDFRSIAILDSGRIDVITADGTP